MDTSEIRFHIVLSFFFCHWMWVDVINITQNSITLFTHFVPSHQPFCLALRGNVWFHIASTARSGIEYMMFMHWIDDFSIVFIHFRLVDDVQRACSLPSIDGGSDSVICRDERTNARRSRTFVLVFFFSLHISNWSICRATVCVILQMCQRRNPSTYIYTFQLGRSLRFVSHNIHAPHTTRTRLCRAATKILPAAAMAEHCLTRG